MTVAKPVAFEGMSPVGIGSPALDSEAMKVLVAACEGSVAAAAKSEALTMAVSVGFMLWFPPVGVVVDGGQKC